MRHALPFPSSSFLQPFSPILAMRLSDKGDSRGEEGATAKDLKASKKNMRRRRRGRNGKSFKRQSWSWPKKVKREKTGRGWGRAKWD